MQITEQSNPTQEDLDRLYQGKPYFLLEAAGFRGSLNAYWKPEQGDRFQFQMPDGSLRYFEVQAVYITAYGASLRVRELLSASC